MKLNFEIDLNNDSREQISLVANLLTQITNAARRPTSAKPAVAENTGSDGTGLKLSPGADAVAGSSIPADKAEPKDEPAVVKERKPRAKKEDAAAPVEKSEADSATNSASPTSETSAPSSKTELSLDDVRAALQAFTAKLGVPAGIELLKEFNAQRISELKEDQFSAFIVKCGA